jgi:protocatechuate 3,4-dioxygenase beta subunit
MPTFSRPYPILFSLCLVFCAPALGQEQTRALVGGVAGRVTASQAPAPRVEVQLLKSGIGQPARAVAAKTTTDKRGRYKFAGVEPGEYYVLPVSATLLVLDRADYNQPGKRVLVTAGESAGGVDFDLSPPSSISGRVTDADGEPVVGAAVRLHSDSSNYVAPADGKPLVTDAQGAYRAVGIPPGRYLVSVGDSHHHYLLSAVKRDDSRRYAETFHPDAADQRKAVEVEVAPGAEAPGIDIRMGRPLKTYEIAGRVIDGETGRPVPGVAVGIVSYGADGSTSSSTSGSWQTDAEGRFTFFGVRPGRYAIAPEADAASNGYAEPVGVEVKEGDVVGLELRTRRAGTVSGTVVLEGAGALAAATKLARQSLYASVSGEGGTSPSSASSRVGPDGGFHLVGLRPGKVMYWHIVSEVGQREFTVLRVEREGVEVRDGLTLGSGENVAGLRVVVVDTSSATGRVRGQVVIEGGTLDGLRLGVYYRRDGSEPNTYNSAEPDARGRFALRNLLEGEYEFTVGPMSVMHTSPAGSKTVSRMPTVKQSVAVKAGAEAEVTLVVVLRP